MKSIKRINDVVPAVDRPFRFEDLQNIWDAIPLLGLGKTPFPLVGFSLDTARNQYTAGVMIVNGVAWYHPDIDGYRLAPGDALYGREVASGDTRTFDDGTVRDMYYDCLLTNVSSGATTTLIGNISETWLATQSAQGLRALSVTRDKIAPRTITEAEIALGGLTSALFTAASLASSVLAGWSAAEATRILPAAGVASSRLTSWSATETTRILPAAGLSSDRISVWSAAECQRILANFGTTGSSELTPWSAAEATRILPSAGVASSRFAAWSAAEATRILPPAGVASSRFAAWSSESEVTRIIPTQGVNASVLKTWGTSDTVRIIPNASVSSDKLSTWGTSDATRILPPAGIISSRLEAWTSSEISRIFPSASVASSVLNVWTANETFRILPAAGVVASKIAPWGASDSARILGSVSGDLSGTWPTLSIKPQAVNRDELMYKPFSIRLQATYDSQGWTISDVRDVLSPTATEFIPDVSITTSSRTIFAFRLTKTGQVVHITSVGLHLGNSDGGYRTVLPTIYTYGLTGADLTSFVYLNFGPNTPDSYPLSYFLLISGYMR